MLRVGLFGGTFNPVHFGHLRTALEVKEGFDLAKVYFIPSAKPPHKDTGGIADAVDRVEMLSRAISGTPGFCLSDVELGRSGRSFTIDTVEQMANALPAETRCFLIVGLDAFLEIDTWRAYRELFEQIDIIVMSRPQEINRTSGGLFGDIRKMVENAVSAEYTFDPEQKRFNHPRLKPVHAFQVTPLAISATRIRQLVRQGASVRYLLPNDVAAYIQEKGLYA